jgi:hypothetical protein
MPQTHLSVRNNDLLKRLQVDSIPHDAKVSLFPTVSPGPSARPSEDCEFSDDVFGDAKMIAEPARLTRQHIAIGACAVMHDSCWYGRPRCT